jgi:hypothetical protein
MDEVPFGAANNRREKIVFAAVQIDHAVAPEMKKSGRPASRKESARPPCPPKGRNGVLSTQAQDWW